MQATRRLRNKIYVPGTLKARVDRLVTNSAKSLEAKLKSNIDDSTPAGRLYRRAAILVRPNTKFLKQKGFKRRKGTLKNVIIGYRIHRASAWGQPPARDFNTLYNSLKVVKNGDFGLTATVKAPGVKFLDDQEYLNRPFFISVIDDFFNQDMRVELLKEIRELIELKSKKK